MPHICRKFTAHRATDGTTERVTFSFITITRSLCVRNSWVKNVEIGLLSNINCQVLGKWFNKSSETDFSESYYVALFSLSNELHLILRPLFLSVLALDYLPRLTELVDLPKTWALRVNICFVFGDLGSVIERQVRRCLAKPRSKPFSILPTVISKHCVRLTVTRRLVSQTWKLFIYLKWTTCKQIWRPTDCLKPRPKLDSV